jgi:predicted GH43/DUF377 family glycosyl hydrolase
MKIQKPPFKMLVLDGKGSWIFTEPTTIKNAKKKFAEFHNHSVGKGCTIFLAPRTDWMNMDNYVHPLMKKKDHHWDAVRIV